MGEWGRSVLHSVEALSGVGPVTAGHMAFIGLGTVEELAGLEAPQARSVAEVVDGLTERNLVDRFLPEARFHLLGDDGGELASALVAAGITSYVELFGVPTQRIANLGADAWDRDRAAQLQLEAARAALCFRVLVHAIDGEGEPLAGPRLEVTDAGLADRRPTVVHEGDAEGWVLGPPLRRDRVHHLSLVAGGHRRSILARPGAPPIQRLTLRFTEPPRSAGVEEHAKPVVLSGRLTFVAEEVPLARARDGEAFRVGRTEGGTTALVGMNRLLAGMTVVTRTISVPAAQVPAGIEERDVVIVEGANLRKASQAETTQAMMARGGRLEERLRA